MQVSRRPLVLSKCIGLAAALLLASCRGVPLAPQASPIAGSPVTTAQAILDPRGDGSQLPRVRDFISSVHDDSLFILARFQPTAPWARPSYDPQRDGAWVMQLFMNTDQEPSGYPWMGIDYLVRGTEILAGRRFVVRHVTLDPDSPGGWGPQSGSARFALHPQSLLLAIPLSAIGNDDGAMDFVFETYLTAACPDCPGGFNQIYLADYFGSTRPKYLDRIAGIGDESVEEVARVDAQRSTARALIRTANPLLNPTSAW